VNHTSRPLKETKPAARSRPRLRFGILGPVRVWRGDDELDLGPRQQRLILAILLVRAGQPVDMAEFIELLWADDPPLSAVNVVHRYVGVLRRLLEPELPSRSNGRWLLKQGSGYRLDVDADSLDLLTARRWAREAERQADTMDARGAVDSYRQSLDLWKGWCGTGLESVSRMHPAFVFVDQEASTLACRAADIALRCTRSEIVLPALRRIAARDPLDEALQARLVLCLAASGKQAEALKLYATVRRHLQSDLGVEPGPELAAAQRNVLEHQFAEVSDRNERPDNGDRPAHTPPPAQLPPDLHAFCGRSVELSLLDNLMSGGVRVAAIDGMPGVGKSALAVHWAHQAAKQFPDGQLYLNLRGFDPQGPPTTPAEALHKLLTGLNVPLSQIPTELDDRAGIYRSLLANRKVLVVLDNAHSTEQVGPLLPGAGPSVAIVTGRNRLTGLDVQGAQMLTVELPSLEDTRENLRVRIGTARVEAEPAAADAIIDCCARLPLAVAVVAARAREKPHFTLASIAAELRATQRTLDAFVSNDAQSDVRAAFSWSYQSLNAAAARLLRLLSLHHGTEISIPAAASLAGLPARQLREPLQELTRARLLSESRPGYYVMHDLVHAFATEQADAVDSSAGQRSAVVRLVMHYQHTTYALERWLPSASTTGQVPEPHDGVTPEVIDGSEAAIQALARISAAVANQIRQAGPGDRDGSP
jgi:DNA-binding SARP family transcriptional activator